MNRENIYSDDEPSEEEYTKLVGFLRGLATSIENKELIPEQIKVIGEFFMSYQFHVQALKDNNNDNNDTEDNNLNNTSINAGEFSKADLIKFLSMGWYIYCCILKQKSIK